MASERATGTVGRDLFQRKTTGLLRGWSVWEGFTYATFSINLITLGIFIFYQVPSTPDGSLVFARVLADSTLSSRPSRALLGSR